MSWFVDEIYGYVSLTKINPHTIRHGTGNRGLRGHAASASKLPRRAPAAVAHAYASPYTSPLVSSRWRVVTGAKLPSQADVAKTGDVISKRPASAAAVPDDAQFTVVAAVGRQGTGKSCVFCLLIPFRKQRVSLLVCGLGFQ